MDWQYCHCQVIWSFGHLVICLFGHLVIQSFDNLVIMSSYHSFVFNITTETKTIWHPPLLIAHALCIFLAILSNWPAIKSMLSVQRSACVGIVWRCEGRDGERSPLYPTLRTSASWDGYTRKRAASEVFKGLELVWNIWLLINIWLMIEIISSMCMRQE